MVPGHLRVLMIACYAFIRMTVSCEVLDGNGLRVRCRADGRVLGCFLRFRSFSARSAAHGCVRVASERAGHLNSDLALAHSIWGRKGSLSR
jgi:hypothetical protein